MISALVDRSMHDGIPANSIVVLPLLVIKDYCRVSLKDVGCFKTVFVACVALPFSFLKICL